MPICTGPQRGFGNRFAVMATGLQEPTELVEVMDRVSRTEEIDVVAGARGDRDDPLFSRMASRLLWGSNRRYVVSEITPGGIDMFGCNLAFRDILMTLEKRHRSLIEQILWLGLRRKCITYNHIQREHGKSAWTFRKMVHYLMDSVFSFPDLPIRLLTRVGGIGAGLASLLGIIVAFTKINGMIQVPGYVTDHAHRDISRMREPYELEHCRLLGLAHL